MNDELTTRLSRELHDQVDGWHAAPLTLDGVRGRARSIRRTRRIAMAGAAAVVVAAIAVPATLGGTGLDRTSPDVPPATDVPSETTVQHTTLTLDGLERGDAPAVEYFTSAGVVLPDQGPTELPVHYNALVRSPADGGWLGWEGPGLDLRYLTEDFQPQGGSATTDGFVSNPDRTAVAWVMPEGGAQTLYLHSTVEPDAGQAWDFPESPTVNPVDFLSDDSLVYETLDGDGNTGIGIAEADGTTTALPGYVSALSASPATGLVAVQTEANRDGSGCYGVVDPASPADPVWETCDHSLGAFSPDGRYLLASGPYLSGMGVTSIAVLDAATGEPVAEWQPPRGSQISLLTTVWESADSFLAVTSEGDQITMLRFGVDGSLEETIDRIQGDPFGDVGIWLGLDRVRKF